MKNSIKKLAIGLTAATALIAVSAPSLAHTVVRFNVGFYGPGYYSGWRVGPYYPRPNWHYRHWCRRHCCDGPRWHYHWHHGYWEKRWY